MNNFKRQIEEDAVLFVIFLAQQIGYVNAKSLDIERILSDYRPRVAL